MPLPTLCRSVFDLHSGSVRTLPGLQGRSERGFTELSPEAFCGAVGDFSPLRGKRGSQLMVAALHAMLQMELGPYCGEMLKEASQSNAAHPALSLQELQAAAKTRRMGA